jgi:DNA-binding response OmpR family regulator
MNILLVEDELHVRQAFGRALSRHGHDVSEAATASDAGELLDARAFDVIIVDVNLPDSTGWDVLRRKLNGRNAATPSVVMSAVPPSVKRVREFAPSSVLLKPFPVDALYRAAELAVASNGEQATHG